MDGDLEAQDFGGLVEILRINEANDLAGDIAEQRAVLLLAVGQELLHVGRGLLKIFEIDTGTRTALVRLRLYFLRAVIGDDHANPICPAAPREEILLFHRQEGIVRIDAANFLLVQFSFHPLEIVDDAAEILLEVIAHRLLHVDMG